MNKQEAIEKLKEVSWECEDSSLVISLDYAQKIISQIDEPQKVTIPKFLEDWLEERKSYNWDLPMAFSRLDMEEDKKIMDWVYDEDGEFIPGKAEIFARAWLDGYEVEKEKRYTVEIPDSNMNSLTVLEKFYDGTVEISQMDVFPVDWRNLTEYHLTEKEIRKDFEWAWQWAKEVEV